MSKLREMAYRIDPVTWVREVLGIKPAAWQETLLRAPQGATPRQTATRTVEVLR